MQGKILKNLKNETSKKHSDSEGGVFIKFSQLLNPVNYLFFNKTTNFFSTH